MIRLVVLDRDHLEDGVLAGERDEREPPGGKPLAERYPPFRGDFVRRRREAGRDSVGDPPGCVGQPRALLVGHRRLRTRSSAERARTKSTSETRFSHGRRSSPEK